MLPGAPVVIRFWRHYTERAVRRRYSGGAPHPDPDIYIPPVRRYVAVPSVPNNGLFIQMNTQNSLEADEAFPLAAFFLTLSMFGCAGGGYGSSTGSGGNGGGSGEGNGGGGAYDVSMQGQWEIVLPRQLRRPNTPSWKQTSPRPEPTYLQVR